MECSICNLETKSNSNMCENQVCRDEHIICYECQLKGLKNESNRCYYCKKKIHLKIFRKLTKKKTDLQMFESEEQHLLQNDDTLILDNINFNHIYYYGEQQKNCIIQTEFFYGDNKYIKKLCSDFFTGNCRIDFLPNIRQVRIKIVSKEKQDQSVIIQTKFI